MFAVDAKGIKIYQFMHSRILILLQEIYAVGISDIVVFEAYGEFHLMFVISEDEDRNSVQQLQVMFSFGLHCMRSVCTRSFSGTYFPAFGLNTERYGVSLCIQSKCGKIWIRKTLNTDVFYAVLSTGIYGGLWGFLWHQLQQHDLGWTSLWLIFIVKSLSECNASIWKCRF